MTDALTISEQQEFDQIQAQIKTKWVLVAGPVDEIAALARIVRTKRLWRGKFNSYDEYAKATFGRTGKAMDSLVWREEKKARAVENPPPEKSTQKASTSNLRYVGTEIVSKDTMSAKVDPELPIHYAKPVAAPTTIAERLNDLVREGMRLPYSDPAFRHFLSGLLALQKHVQGEMTSILDQVPAVKPRSRCTIEEAKAFCKTIGLPEDDGEWFYWKMDGAGWKNSGVAVASWQGTIQAWKRAGYMCSQMAASRAHRNGGPEKPEQRASKELDREIAKLRRGQ